MDLELSKTEEGLYVAEVCDDVLSPCKCVYDGDADTVTWVHANSGCEVDAPKCGKRVEKLLERFVELFR